MRVPVTPLPHQHYVSLLHDSHLTGYVLYLIVALICIFLVTNDIENLFMCLFATRIALWEIPFLDFLPIFTLDCLFA